MAIGAGAQEVDVVISVGDILEKNYEKVYRELKAIRKVCENVRLKVILETGELKDLESIFNASLIAAYAGADFIKTSTGKVPVNATPESVYVMCEAIRQYYAQTGKRVGLKVAGGVSKAQNAIRYLTIVNHVLGCEWLTPYYFRIGASQLMDDIVLFFFIFMFYFQLIFIDVFFFIVNLKKWFCPESTFTDAVLHGQ